MIVLIDKYYLCNLLSVCQRPYSARLSMPKKIIPGIPYSKQFKLSRSFLAVELCCRSVSTDQGGAKDGNHSDPAQAGTKTAEDDTSGSTDQSPKVVKGQWTACKKYGHGPLFCIYMQYQMAKPDCKSL